MAGTFEVYEDKSGKFRFRLKAATGEVVATSAINQTATTKDGARSAVQAVQDAAAGATIEMPD